MRGRETERVRDAVFAGEQAGMGRSPGEIVTVTSFFSRSASPVEFWSQTMDGFDPKSRAEVLPEDLPVVTYFSDPAKAQGRWVTETPLENPQRDLALPPDNQALQTKAWVIPAGTLVLRGTCAPIFGQPGGASQIFLSNPNVLRTP